QQGVEGCGDAELPAREHDLAVEVVGLDGAGAAGQALPRRATGMGAPLDRPALEAVDVVLGPVLVHRGELDAGGGETVDALLLGAGAEVGAPGGHAGGGVQGVAEV